MWLKLADGVDAKCYDKSGKINGKQKHRYKNYNNQTGVDFFVKKTPTMSSSKRYDYDTVLLK